MDLVLFGSNEGTLIDVGVDFDVRVVAQFERVLASSALSFSLVVEGRTGRIDIILRESLLTHLL